MHPLDDPRDPLKTQYNPLKFLLGRLDFGLRDLWLSESYHPSPVDEGSYHPRSSKAEELGATEAEIDDAAEAGEGGGGGQGCYNSGGPGGPTGPLGTPFRNPGTLSGLTITH